MTGVKYAKAYKDMDHIVWYCRQGDEFLKTEIITEMQDLTFLKWAHARASSGTVGTFLKSESSLDGKKVYYKLSNFDQVHGVVGHECANEIIADRLLTVLGVEHLHYRLINAQIEIEGRKYQTWLCESEDFKKRGESKTALDDYYRVNARKGESHYDFCVRNGWQKYIDEMIVVDFLILNRDRHGANIEVLRNSRAHTLRIAPLFDHGLSFLCTCMSDKEAKRFDITEDKRCQNFIGSFSCYENLSLIKNKKTVFANKLKESDSSFIFDGLEGVISKVLLEKIREMIFERYRIYESL